MRLGRASSIDILLWCTRRNGRKSDVYASNRRTVYRQSRMGIPEDAGQTTRGRSWRVSTPTRNCLITVYTVTDASVHDSNELEKLVDIKKDTSVYADSAYKGEEIEKCLGSDIENNIIEKGYRNKPLTDEQKVQNRIKSKTRVRIEHVFGFMTTTLRGIMIRSIGKVRAEFNIGLLNLTYNMCRYIFLVRSPC